jgi:peptidyl-prolyl cis-trans isomerase A (cyclophilin A)
MLKRLALLACSLFFTAAAVADNPRVLFQTSLGDIELELAQDKAPISVQNFLAYVDSGHYNGTIFHRVIPNFMVQGGGFDGNMRQKETRAPIRNEADNGLRNDRGTVAMARTSARDSATSQFFINHSDNDFLNHGGRDFGYAVFGKVVRGMDVVDRIAQVPTTRLRDHSDVPRQAVEILSVKRL